LQPLNAMPAPAGSTSDSVFLNCAFDESSSIEIFPPPGIVRSAAAAVQGYNPRRSPSATAANVLMATVTSHD
jgi:hypothetical protein